ncbi:MAG: glycosyltransferase family 4 protein [Candidatus Moranbacteria bacterium]|nr:glycosyltransferase family 4 protein [Candidatus Moranbacteria bacterium]
MVKYILKRTDNFIAYGTRAKNYLISLDAPKEKIKIIFHNVDIDKFSQESENFSRKEKNKLKEKLGIKTNKIILFSGQLIERKGIFELLNGFNNYTKLDSNVSLLVLGQGREKEKMEEIIRNKNIQNVFFTGFIQYNELYKFYSISDLFILPSREEVWGLAINEAMACGLPIITTHETGASVDLIEEGKNGYIIPSNNSKAITQAIQKVFQNNLHKKNNSWQIVQKTRVEDVLKKVKI